jgi:hypothetical protein
VLRFSFLGTTEQGEYGTQFRVDYLKPSGAIGFYHPDWVIVQTTNAGGVNWIVEMKDRVWEGTAAKRRGYKELVRTGQRCDRCRVVIDACQSSPFRWPETDEACPTR